MKTALIAYTKRALQTACKVAACLEDRTSSQKARYPEETNSQVVPICQEEYASQEDAAHQKTETAIYTLPRFLQDQDLVPVTGPGREQSNDLGAENGFALPLYPIPSGDADFYFHLFQEVDLLIFVSALGIAVRKIAPYVKDKKQDPAVLCMDEQGRYVISVLSGHIGGANEAARMIAQKLQAQAVITTATDVNHRFSVDTWATEHGLIIADMQAAKAVSAAILEQDIPMLCEPPVTLSCMRQAAASNAGEEPGADEGADAASRQSPEERLQTRKICRSSSGIVLPHSQTDVGTSAVGIYVGWKRKNPFSTTLRLIPKVLHLGIGCRKGTSWEQIQRAVNEVLAQNQIDPRAVCGVYSIDLKKEEPGLLAFCEKHGWELQTYSAEELLAVEGEFSSSGFVQRITGVDNVCERAAVKTADKLVVRKYVLDGVTVALAAKKLELPIS